MVGVEYTYFNLDTSFDVPCVPEPPRWTQTICDHNISGAPETRVMKEFRILHDSTLWNDLPSIALKHPDHFSTLM